jgi:hypothetical protein
MAILGLRCTNRGYSFAVLSGARNAPTLEAYETVAVPKGYAKPQTLKWFFQEIQDLSRRFELDGIVMKGAEGQAVRDKAFVERIELEAMVFYAGAQFGIKPVLRKVKSQLAKSLGLKGRPKYLDRFDTSAVGGYEHLSKNVQEAVLAAWSELT